MGQDDACRVSIFLCCNGRCEYCFLENSVPNPIRRNVYRCCSRHDDVGDGHLANGKTLCLFLVVVVEVGLSIRDEEEEEEEEGRHV